VAHVNWEDALGYTKWLSQQTGAKYRLPSEAEWEYAARAGTTSHFWWGRSAKGGHAHCGFGCDSPLNTRGTAEVGSFAPNAFGLYDTAGNVSEWVHDCYHDSYKDAPRDASVWEGGDCSVRVIRGGSYAASERALRSANRETHRSANSNDETGFRIVREP
jgi:formylglycine-generating enzyme required for sulfatase activity